MTDVLLPLPPEDEIRRLRLQQSIDEDRKPNPLVQRVLEPGLPLRLRCQVCQHKWDFPWEKGMLVEVMLARLKANLVCPRCGTKSRRGGKKNIVILPSKEITP